MNDLVERLRTAILAHKQLAEAATKGEWTPDDGGIVKDHDFVNQIVSWVFQDADRAYIIANQPSTIIRHCTVDLRRLDAHTGFDFPANQDDGPGDYAWTPHCTECWQPTPCATVRDLAEAYGLTEDQP